jgi:hypothetical protein
MCGFDPCDAVQERSAAGFDADVAARLHECRDADRAQDLGRARIAAGERKRAQQEERKPQPRHHWYVSVRLTLSE